MIYRSEEGETLGTIADRFDISVEALNLANPHLPWQSSVELLEGEVW